MGVLQINEKGVQNCFLLFIYSMIVRRMTMELWNLTCSFLNGIVYSVFSDSHKDDSPHNLKCWITIPIFSRYYICFQWFHSFAWFLAITYLPEYPCVLCYCCVAVQLDCMICPSVSSALLVSVFFRASIQKINLVNIPIKTSWFFFYICDQYIACKW